MASNRVSIEPSPSNGGRLQRSYLSVSEHSPVRYRTFEAREPGPAPRLDLDLRPVWTWACPLCGPGPANPGHLGPDFLCPRVVRGIAIVSLDAEPLTLHSQDA